MLEKLRKSHFKDVSHAPFEFLFYYTIDTSEYYIETNLENECED